MDSGFTCMTNPGLETGAERYEYVWAYDVPRFSERSRPSVIESTPLTRWKFIGVRKLNDGSIRKESGPVGER